MFFRESQIEPIWILASKNDVFSVKPKLRTKLHFTFQDSVLLLDFNSIETRAFYIS